MKRHPHGDPSSGAELTRDACGRRKVRSELAKFALVGSIPIARSSSRVLFKVSTRSSKPTRQGSIPAARSIAVVVQWLRLPARTR